jgi:hypothetical protein
MLGGDEMVGVEARWRYMQMHDVHIQACTALGIKNVVTHNQEHHHITPKRHMKVDISSGVISSTKSLYRPPSIHSSVPTHHHIPSSSSPASSEK